MVKIQNDTEAEQERKNPGEMPESNKIMRRKTRKSAKRRAKAPKDAENISEDDGTGGRAEDEGTKKVYIQGN